MARRAFLDRRGGLDRGLHRMLVGLLVLASSVMSGTVRAETTPSHAAARPLAPAAAVRGLKVGTHGRIVISGAARPYAVRIEGRRLIVIFRKPVSGRFASVARALPAMIASTALGKDRRTLTFRLRGAYRLRTVTANRAVRIDIFPRKALAAKRKRPKRNVEKRPRVMARAPARKPSPAPKRRPRSTPPRKPTAVESGTGHGATTAVSAPKREVAARKPGSGIAKRDVAERPGDPAGATATRRRADPAPARKVASRTDAAAKAKPVATVLPDTASSVAPDARRKRTVGAAGPIVAPLTTATVVGRQGAAAKGVVVALARPSASVAARAAIGKGIVVPLKPVEARGAQAKGTVKPLSGETEKGAERSPVRSGLGIGNAIPVRFFTNGEAGYVLRFDWPVPVAAAVYRRGGHVWMVFDRAETLDLAPARLAGDAATATLEPVSLALGSAARIKVAPGFNPAVRRDGTSWIVSIRRQSGVPARPIPVEAQPRAPVEPRVLLAVKDAVEPRLLKDAERKETLFVVPMRTLGSGVASDHDYTEFRLFATAQGIVVRPQADDVSVRRVRDGVQITSASGLKISARPARTADVRWPGERRAVARLFDFDAWRRDKIGTFTEVKQMLQTAAADASPVERGRRRVDLAQFYLARGFAVDALGTLQLIAKDDVLADEPAFHALFGATALLAGDLVLARRELLDPKLDNAAEAQLWRGVLFARLHDWSAAAKQFLDGRSLLRFYSEPYKSRFALLAARASLETNDAGRALRYLNLLPRGKTMDAVRTEAAYLRARALQADGGSAAALVLWERAIKEGKGPARLEAEVARIGLLTKQGKMARKDAIAKLESLRFQWRGDDIEFDVLRLLGQTYLANAEYLKGLDRLRQAVTYFPTYPKSAALRDRMRAVFGKLFLDGAADKLSPIKALAMFREFRGLIPKGARGDAMIDRLVDRLVAMELLDRAAALVEKQMTERGSGAARMSAGARLAEIELIAKRPRRALRALDNSRGDNPPRDLAEARRQLRARALVEMDRAEQALALIAGDKTREAQRLRAGIYWRAGQWANAAGTLGALAAPVKIVDGKLRDADARLILSWAVALTLSGDQTALTELRRRFDSPMEASAFRTAYRVLATDVNGEVSDYRALLAKVREADAYEAFLSSYRKRLLAAAGPTDK